MKINTRGLFSFASLAVLALAIAEPIEKSAVMVEVDPPPKQIGKDYKDYWEIMAKGEFVKDLRPVNPADSTDLREFALSLPILETPGESGYAFVYRFSEAAPEAATWTLPGDGAQERMEIRRLEPGPDGAQRIAFARRLWRGAPMKAYTYHVQLERRPGGWLVLNGKFLKPKPEAKTEGKKKPNGEPSGARQSGAAVKSKTENKEKAKPESDERSQ